MHKKVKSSCERQNAENEWLGCNVKIQFDTVRMLIKEASILNCTSYSTIWLSAGKRDIMTKMPNVWMAVWTISLWNRKSHLSVCQYASTGAVILCEVCRHAQYIKSKTNVYPHFTALKSVISYRHPPFLFWVAVLSDFSFQLSLSLSLWACDPAADLWEL